MLLGICSCSSVPRQFGYFSIVLLVDRLNVVLIQTFKLFCIKMNQIFKVDFALSIEPMNKLTAIIKKPQSFTKHKNPNSSCYSLSCGVTELGIEDP